MSDDGAVLRRRRADLSDHRRKGAVGRAAVAVVGREVSLEDGFGPIGLGLRVEALEEALAQRGAGASDRLVHQFVLGGEVRVEAADRERSALHHVRHGGARDPLFTDQPRGGLQDRFVRPFLPFDLGVHLRSPRTGLWARFTEMPARRMDLILPRYDDNLNAGIRARRALLQEAAVAAGSSTALTSAAPARVHVVRWHRRCNAIVDAANSSSERTRP